MSLMMLLLLRVLRINVSGVRVCLALAPVVELLLALADPLEFAAEALLVLLQLLALAHGLLVLLEDGRGLEMDITAIVVEFGLRIKEIDLGGNEQEILQKTFGTRRSGYGRFFSALPFSKSVIKFVGHLGGRKKNRCKDFLFLVITERVGVKISQM